ncbi:SRPBCC domain-containing protein [Aeoliella sp. ICT_H6.2]|uniref:SRPBCC domain-containing protein n=1 Tax=Aeoliella straminimaris TaxID=2954799 RepID=A0A9X2JGL1_9BACT|nr:SRPBCC domain-containing protein [Aeoliella straminimaris]MCO6045145.1 SRPBCC domain-containing protein [Aeoliella straminimaris]
MADIVQRIGIKAPPSKVYEALATLDGLAGWWTQEVAGDSEPGGVIVFTFRTGEGELKGEMGMQVESLTPNTKVAWRCVEGPDDWLKTEISFTLSEQDGQTIVLFAHRGWSELSEHMAHCTMKWATFLLSLRELVETGTGKPAPRDVKVDNWY